LWQPPRAAPQTLKLGSPRSASLSDNPEFPRRTREAAARTPAWPPFSPGGFSFRLSQQGETGGDLPTYEASAWPAARTQQAAARDRKAQEQAEAAQPSEEAGAQDDSLNANKHNVEAVYRSLRNLHEKHAEEAWRAKVPFAGKVMVFGGDFRQILPVVPGSNRAGTVAASLKRSDLWPIMKVFHLGENMRVKRMATQDSARAATYEQWASDLDIGNGVGHGAGDGADGAKMF